MASIDPHQRARQERADSISFRQLKMFESIARLNSVRKASEECNLSQPAVTQALAKLEERIGTPLVERRASGSFLNEAGEVFQRRTARFFEQTERALIQIGVPGGAAGAEQIAKRLSRSQIRSLIGIVDHHSFVKAADALGLSTASLQRAARDLESNLRKSLFYRSAAGMMVAPHGAEFGRKMKLALQEIDWGLREIEAAKGGFATELVIGGMPFGGSILLTSALDAFIRVYPQVGVRIMIENAPSMHQSLRDGDVDLVVGLLPENCDAELACDAFTQTPYSVVARANHPLTRQDHVTIQHLLAYDWVIGSHGSNRRACFDRLFAGHGTPNTPIVTCALFGLHKLLADSDRLTLMTSYELEQETGGLARVPFGPIDVVPTIGITMRAEWLPTTMHSNFIEIIRGQARANMPRPALRKVVG